MIGAILGSAAVLALLIAAYRAPGRLPVREGRAVALLAALSAALVLYSLFVSAPGDWALSAAVALSALVVLIHSGSSAHGGEVPSIEEGTGLVSGNPLLMYNRYALTGLLTTGLIHNVRHALSQISLLTHRAIEASSEAHREETLHAVGEYAKSALTGAEELLGFVHEDVSLVDCRFPEDFGPTLRFLRTLCHSRGVGFSLRCDDMLLPVAKAELSQILTNLVYCSLEGIEEDAREAAAADEALRAAAVELFARRVESVAMIDVIHPGKAVGSDEVAALREPGQTEPGDPRGGLFISRQVARFRGGELVSMPLGARSCYRVTLPLNPD